MHNLMGIGQKLPVIVGLAVGVGFVLIVYLIFQAQSSRIISSFHGTTIYIPEGTVLEKKNFDPQNPTIVIGQNNTVRWINQEQLAVQLNIDGKCEPIREYDAMTIESSSIQVWLNPDDSFACEFYVPGSYIVHTAPWPWMQGTITVTRDRVLTK